MDTDERVVVAEKPSMLSNVIAIIGFIILIVIVIWGLFHIANLSRSWFSSLFQKPAPAIEVSAPGTVNSKEPFTISWKYTPSTQGSYAFLYQCESGLRFETKNASGDTASIPCGASFEIASSDNTLTVMPIISSATSSITLPLTIIFIPSSTGAQAQGSALVTITNTEPQAPTKPEKPTTTHTSTTASGKPHASGPANLTVKILAASIDPNGVASVTFDIGNTGGSPTGVYFFTTSLPTRPDNFGRTEYTYNSPSQPSLNPGDHIVSTLRFTQAIPGMFAVTVDPDNTVRESNKSDNAASQVVQGPMYNQGVYPIQMPPQPYGY